MASASAGSVSGQGGAVVEAVSIVEARPTEYGGAVVVGGPGAVDHWENGIAHKFFRMIAHDGKPVGGLSLGVVFLAKAGLLEGKAATIWVTPDALRALKDAGARYEKKPVVVAGRHRDGRRPGVGRELRQHLRRAPRGLPDALGARHALTASCRLRSARPPLPSGARRRGP